MNSNLLIGNLIDSLYVFCITKFNGFESNNPTSEPCNWVGELYKQQTHYVNECPNYMLLCPGCTASVPRRLFDVHVQEECSFRRIKCSYCNDPTLYLPADLTEHHATCSDFPISCFNIGCLNLIPRGRLHQHCDDECMCTLIQCPFSELNCCDTCEGPQTRQFIINKHANPDQPIALLTQLQAVYNFIEEDHKQMGAEILEQIALTNAQFNKKEDERALERVIHQQAMTDLELRTSEEITQLKAENQRLSLELFELQQQQQQQKEGESQQLQLVVPIRFDSQPQEPTNSVAAAVESARLSSGHNIETLLSAAGAIYLERRD